MNRNRNVDIFILYFFLAFLLANNSYSIVETCQLWLVDYFGDSHEFQC